MWAGFLLSGLFLGSLLLADAARINSYDLRSSNASSDEPLPEPLFKASKELGIFTGLMLENDFDGAELWDRDCNHHLVKHTKDAEEIYSAFYNDCSGVSDLVFYGAHGSRFVSGNGRGAGWQDDNVLNDIMKADGKKRTDYATAQGYQGVGYFGIDRGHQAPVGTYNADKVMATMTNMVTNLSPQNFYLNQRNWMYLESDMRTKALSTEEADEGTVELLTGPLYELPEAFFKNKAGKELWGQLLDTGGEANKGTPWCGEKEGRSFHSETVYTKAGKEAEMSVECQTQGRKRPQKASDNPNALKMYYKRSEKYFPLRVPLGYYKLMVMKSGSRFGRRTCAYVMDQVGQCLLVSLELLTKMAHLDLSGTEFAEKGGTTVQDSGSDAEYNAYVNPHFCIPPHGTLRRTSGCLLKSNTVTDPSQITVRLMNEYWSHREWAS